MSLFPELDAPPLPTHLGPASVAERPTSKVLHEGQGSLKSFDYSLNPYIGCGFACAYCFAAAFVADEERRRSWGKWIEVKTSAESQIAKIDLRGKKIFMSSSTDPYQPLERKVRLTRRIVELLVEKQPNLVVQTRSPIAVRDIDLFQQLAACRVNMSITTDCDEIRKRFEPSCASIPQRLDAIRRIREGGIKTAICIAPMLPIRDVDNFARLIEQAKPDKVVSSYFHSTENTFSANTRDPALPLIKEYDWTRQRFEDTLGRLRERVPITGWD